MANSKTNQVITKNKRLLIITSLIALCFIFGIVIWAGWLTSKVNTTEQQVQLDKTRQMALITAKMSKIPVPVDARTGEFFFAQEKLMLPAKDEDRRLTYGYLPSLSGNAGNFDLSVSNDFVFLKAAAPLYEAVTIEDLQGSIPELDACQRGVRIIEKQIPELAKSNGLELRKTLNVGNDRTVYLYADKLCSNLDDVLYQLGDLKAY